LYTTGIRRREQD
jgi:hypothetical protein